MSSTSSSTGLIKAIALTGLLAGTLDIAAAIVMYVTATGKSGLDVLRYIASGAFGTTAFSGGMPMSIAGLIFHYIIAYSFTTIYFILYKKIILISKNAVINAVVYGIIVWIVMNIIVLPLSNVPPFTFDLAKAIKGATILILAIGVPVSFLANRFYSK
ncbi:MAG TPA: hypothetical protein VIM65_07825 [Cyclobacteriaceae bacterium]